VLARFFIDRPVLAWVISVVIILLGSSPRPSCRSPSTRRSRLRPSA